MTTHLQYKRQRKARRQRLLQEKGENHADALKLESRLVNSIELSEMKCVTVNKMTRGSLSTMIDKTHKHHKSDEGHIAALARTFGI